MNQATNWSPNGVPTPMTPTPDTNGAYGDLMLFDGRTTGPLSITQSGGIIVGFGGAGYPAGSRLRLTSNQVGSVNIISPGGTSGGYRMNWFSVDAGAGALIIGNDNGVDIFDIVAGELNGQVAGFTNNSATPSVINPGTRFRLGGAGFHPFVFAGIGDWILRNHMRSAASGAIGFQIDGPGTVTWSGTNTGSRASNWFDNLGTPLRINGGTLILKSSDLVSTDAGTVNIIHNGTLLKFDSQPAPGLITDPATIPGNLSGSGPIQVNAGIFTFSGASTFTGDINLTGGELIAGSVENVGLSGPLGQGGTISFNGGTLGFGQTNAFDYSPRFSTATGQAYSIDTGGQNVTIAAGLSSVGGSLTKLGGGRLTLAGTSSYDGLTTINLGTLTFQGAKTGTGNIIMADFATLGVFENGAPVTATSLTLGTYMGCLLEFNNVTNTTTAPLVAATLSSVGNITININSGSFTAIGQTFPLLSWTNGSAPRVFLGTVMGAAGLLSTNGNTIQFIVTSVPLVWTGASNSNWSNPGNWTAPYSDPKLVLFDDTASGTTSVTVDIPVHPASVAVANNTKTYSITSSGVNNIAGGTGLTKSGSGTLTLSGGANTYTGITTLNGGTASVGALANGGSLSDIGSASTAAGNIVLNGGTLRYTGSGVGINRLFSVGPNGGTIDSEGTAALAFNNTGALGMSGEGPRTLTLTGPNNFGDTIASAVVNHPAGTSLTKDGVGTWTLTGTNTYGGTTTIANGVLQIGAGGNSGSLGSGIVTNNGALVFNRTGTLLVSGPVRGTGSVINDGTGTVILANDNTYSGGTTINAGTLQVGNGGSNGSLKSTAPIVNNSLLVFNTSGAFTYGPGASGIISGIGNVIVQGGGFIKAIGNNTYLGWTRIDANTTFQPIEGQDGTTYSFVITNNGTLRLVTQNIFTYPGPIVGTGRVQIGANAVIGSVTTLTGTNTYTGGTFIGGNELVLGDGSTPRSGEIAGNVQFVNNFTLGQDAPRKLTFNRPDNFTFSGTITTNFTSPQANLGIVHQNGTGTLTLTGNNTYGGGTIVNSGSLVIGNGGSGGSVGSGPVTLNSGNPLVINRSGSLTIPGAITGSDGVTLIGPGTVSLTSANNTYFGATTVSNGTLVTTSVGGDLNVEGGTIVVQNVNISSNLNVPGNMNIDSGTVVATLNKTTAHSNTTYTFTGTITRAGGSLKLLTAGVALMPGDKFFIFNKAVIGGAAMPIISPGCTVQNDLAVDGSVTVLTAQPIPAITTTVVGGTQLNLSWPASWTGGAHLQAQTNSINSGLRSNWVDVAGTDTVNTYSTPINKTNGSVFYRLVIP